MPRIRYKDQTYSVSPGATIEIYRKPNGDCNATPVWETSPPAVRFPSNMVFGKYSHMIDHSDNPPKRKLEPKRGYTFNGMTSAVVECHPGGDTEWGTEPIADYCSGPQTYRWQYRRRVFGGDPWSNQMAGLSIVGIGGIHPNILDLTSYGLPEAEISRMRGLVATSVRSKRGRGSDTNLWEAAAEVNKTLGMLSAYMQSARKIAKAAFSRRAARDLTNETAGTYLMTRYGFQPLVKDIFTTLLALEEDLGRRLERTRAQEVSKLSSQSATQITDWNAFNYTKTMTTETDIVVRAVSVDEYVLSMMQKFGLGTKNLLSVPYELVSYSFVLDWFVNVGDFIGAVVPEPGLTHIGGCTSVRVEKTWVCHIDPIGLMPEKVADTNVTRFPSPTSCGRTLKYYDRDSALPVPSIRMKSDFKFDNFLRAADATSLLIQKLSSFRPKGHH